LTFGLQAIRTSRRPAPARIVNAALRAPVVKEVAAMVELEN
jgi:hypothetical protein